MNTKRFCELSGVSPNTFRKWTADFAPFLSPTGAPQKGKARVLSDRDQRVLFFVHTMRGAGYGIDGIHERLQSLQTNGWQGLPDLPPEWGDPGESMSIAAAAARAGELAEIAVLRSELDHTRTALTAAQERADQLAAELSLLRTSHQATETDLHEAQIALERAQGDVAALRARLQGYALGSDKPINIGLIIGAALLAGAVLVALAVVLGALVG